MPFTDCVSTYVQEPLVIARRGTSTKFESLEEAPILKVIHCIVYLIIYFCNLKMTHSSRNTSSSA